LSEFRPATARTNHRPRHSVFNDYSGLLAALRLRAEDQKIVITSPDVAKVSGLADALVAKILSPKMPRRLSFQSMHPVLSLLGVRLAMIEDPETMSRYTSRLKKRDENCVHSGTVHVLISRRELRKRQQKDGQNSRKYMSAAAARALARHAANSRWAVVKAKKAAQAAAKAARRRAPAQAKAA
jgi:hypothetical protein